MSENEMLNYDGPWANPHLGTKDRDGRIEVMMSYRHQGLNNRQISNTVHCGQITVARYIGPDNTTPPNFYDNQAARLIRRLGLKRRYKNQRRRF